MTSLDNLSFITNNVKRIQSLKKRLKLIEYFKSKIMTHRILFLQETDSSSEDEQKWQGNFSSNTFFSHGKANSCGFLISKTGMQNSVEKKKLVMMVKY